jgi:hypothetical protein
MIGVPLTTAGGAAAEGGTATKAEGGGADAQRDDARETEGVARQDAEAVLGDEAEGIAPTAEPPSDDAERAMMTVGTTVAAPASPEAAATPYGDLHATTSTGGSLEAIRRKGRMQPSLKPHCLLPALPSAKPTPSRARRRRAGRSSARHRRSRGLRGLELVFSKQIVFFGAVVVIDANTGCLYAGSLGGACAVTRRCERPAPTRELFFCCTKRVDQV